MAAEKLTKKRLIQILIMLCILVIAFIWRYFEKTRKSLLIFKTNRLFPINFTCHTFIYTYNSTPLSLGGEIGRRSGFKIRR